MITFLFQDDICALFILLKWNETAFYIHLSRHSESLIEAFSEVW